MYERKTTEKAYSNRSQSPDQSKTVRDKFLIAPAHYAWNKGTAERTEIYPIPKATAKKKKEKKKEKKEEKKALIASLEEMGRKMNCRTKFGDNDTLTHPLYTNTGYDPGRVDPTIDSYLDETRINLEEMSIPPGNLPTTN